MKKRLLAWILTLAMMLPFMPSGLVFASDPLEGPHEAVNMWSVAFDSDTATPVATAGITGGAYVAWDKVDNTNEDNQVQFFVNSEDNAQHTSITKLTLDVYVADDRVQSTRSGSEGWDRPVLQINALNEGSGSSGGPNWALWELTGEDYTGTATIGGFSYAKTTIEFTFNNSTQIAFALFPHFKTDLPVYIGNVTLHYPVADSLTGAHPVESFWEGGNEGIGDSILPDTREGLENAFLAWENVQTDGTPWQGTYYGEHKQFYAEGAASPEQVLKLTFDLYTPADRTNYNGDYPVPQRFGITPSARGTVTSHPGEWPSISFGAPNATVGGRQYVKTEVAIEFEGITSADQLMFTLEAKFNTDHPIYIANAMVHYTAEEEVLAPGLYGFADGYPNSALVRTPLEASQITVTSDQAGSTVLNMGGAYMVNEQNTAGAQWEWLQNPLRLIPDPDDGPINNIKGISLTAYMPANVFYPADGANAPHIRFDYTVAPASPAFIQGANSSGLFVSPWLIAQGVEANAYREAASFASGTYNNAPGEIPEGPRPLEDYSFNFDEKVYIDGKPYIKIDYVIEYSTLVPIEKEELIFTFSIANIRFQDPVYIAENIHAVYHTGPWGGDHLGGFGNYPDIIYMDGKTDGMNLTGYGVPSYDLKLPSTHRGTWSGHQSRMAVTNEGVFVTYVNKELSEAGKPFGEEDGYHWADRRSVVFAMKPANCPDGNWVVLGQWAHNSNIPILMSDPGGNVYLAMYKSTADNPTQTGNSTNFRPFIAKYNAGSWSTAEGTLTTPLEEHEKVDWGNFLGEYTSANISPDGKIYLFAVENDRGGSEEGYITVAIFDTVIGEWTKMGKVWTGPRQGYAYINFVENSTGGYDIEFIVTRMERGDRVGYNIIGDFVWVYDGLVYWRISPDFTDSPVPGSSLPPQGYVGFETVPHYITVIKERELNVENPSNYSGNNVPRIFFSGTGDVFWDDNGDIHVFSANDLYNNIGAPMHHMLVRDGEVIFNKQIFSNSRTLVMLKDSNGGYYLLESSSTTGSMNSSANIYKATDTSDSGWTWTPEGAFTLPEPVRIYGYSQAYNAGIAGHGDSIHVMYPVRGPYFLPQGMNQADEWAYFKLNLLKKEDDKKEDDKKENGIDRTWPISSRSSGGGITGAIIGLVTPANTPVNVTRAAAVASTNDAIAAARAAGSANAAARLRNPGEISLSLLQTMARMANQAGMTLRLQADSMTADNRAVDVRITLDPAQSTQDLNLSASTTNTQATRTKNTFTRFFNNDVMVVSLGQQGGFGQQVRIAARLDSNLNTENLVIYAYDRATNSYRQIREPNIRLDANGYIHFDTTLGGDIMISDGPLARK